MKKENRILEKVTEKLLSIRHKKEWEKELLPLAPPVLWFGNKNTKKKIILTLGANPSRREFLEDNKKQVIKRLVNTNTLNYLDNNKKRFFHFRTKSELLKCVKDENLQNEIIKSYNNYFMTGNNYLNGMDASYFGTKELQALHIDLFPFATISDFTSIKELCEKDLFSSNWAKDILVELIQLIRPVCIIIFGKSNYRYFSKIFCLDKKTPELFRINKPDNKYCKCNYWVFEFNKIPTCGLSVNLGNPRGFDKKQLNLLGTTISKKIL